MKRINLTKEMREELLATYAEFLPAEKLVVVTFNNKNEGESDFEKMMCSMHDDIILAPGQDKDYKVSYWNKHNEETHICLGAMNELDAEHRFNDMFPDCIFITAKEIVL